MHILLLGATGFSGSEVLRQLLATSHTLTLLVRDPNRLPPLPPSVRIAQGDALDVAALRQALKNQDAVLHCLGIGGKGNGQPNTLVSDATRLLVQEMQAAGVRRLIAMSNVGAGDSAGFQPWWFRRILLPYFLPWLQAIINDKNRMEPIVQQSDLDWVLVRCPNLLDQPAKGAVHATTTAQGLRFSLANADAAAFLIQQLEDDRFLRQAPCISRP